MTTPLAKLLTTLTEGDTETVFTNLVDLAHADVEQATEAVREAEAAWTTAVCETLTTEAMDAAWHARDEARHEWERAAARRDAIREAQHAAAYLTGRTPEWRRADEGA